MMQKMLRYMWKCLGVGVLLSGTASAATTETWDWSPASADAWNRAPEFTKGKEALKAAFAEKTQRWGNAQYQEISYNQDTTLVTVGVDVGSGRVILRMFIYGCNKEACRLLSETAADQFLCGALNDAPGNNRADSEKEFVLRTTANGYVFQRFQIIGKDLTTLRMSSVK